MIVNVFILGYSKCHHSIIHHLWMWWFLVLKKPMYGQVTVTNEMLVFKKYCHVVLTFTQPLLFTKKVCRCESLKSSCCQSFVIGVRDSGKYLSCHWSLNPIVLGSVLVHFTWFRCIAFEALIIVLILLL